MESELKPLKDGVLLINSSITDLNSDTQSVLVSMNEINASGLNESLAVMKNTLEQMKKDLSRSSEDINVTRKELRELDRNVSQIYNDSAALRDDLKFVIDSIDAADAALLSLHTDLQNTYNATCAVVPSTQQCMSMQDAIQNIQRTREVIQDRTVRIRSLYNNLANIARRSAELHEKLNQTDLRLQNMQSSLSNYTSEISNIHGNITKIEKAIHLLENVKEQSSSVSIQMDKLTMEMANGTSALVSDIDRTKEMLGEVIARSPAVIASPITLDQIPVFRGRSYLDFLLPGIISIVLMFISFLLASITIVQERSKRTLMRTLMTPISLEGFILEKTACLILIALLQGIILITVAFVFYGAVVPVSQIGELFLVILVYAAAFIGIGMALATFAESENTAMLLTLVLSIPMLFMSGVFFPFETMPELMIQVGNALPITMGIRALESVLIYQGGINALSRYLMPLIGYGIAGLGVAYVLLRREVTD
jgi:ABC-type multidrug transport system permease subunit/predicted  nucleic acid-binding Zn-ribbon protein